jgi:hypothetical protein
LAGIESKLTLWEAWTFSWYGENVSAFAREMGIVADNFKELRIRGMSRRLFLKAMNMIRDAVEKVADEQAKKAAEENSNK